MNEAQQPLAAVKTWQERMPEPRIEYQCSMNCSPANPPCDDCLPVKVYGDAVVARDAEIADLRAALKQCAQAAQGGGVQADVDHIRGQITADANCILRLLDIVDKLMGSTSGATESIQEHAQHIIQFAAKLAAHPAPSVAPVGWIDPMSVINLQHGLSTKEWMWAKPEVGNVPVYVGAAPAQVARTEPVAREALGPLDANELERMAKSHPDECFLKGSGVLKLIGAIRTLEQSAAHSSPAAGAICANCKGALGGCHLCQGTGLAAPVAPSQPQQVEACWTKQPPTEPGDYWHWNGDEDSAPTIYHVMWSGTAKKCFLSIGQYDITDAIWCDKFGGWWMPIEQPATPDRAHQASAKEGGDA